MPLSQSTLSARLTSVIISLVFAPIALAQGPDPEVYLERSKAFSAQMEARGLAQEFRGVTTDGEPLNGLFPVSADGIDTTGLASAATNFLQTLTPEQLAITQFAVEDEEWRKWGNQHIYYRQGVSFEQMNPEQQDAAWALLDASLSSKGMTLTRDIMRLNETLGELNGNNFVEYGEGKYWLTIMGNPANPAEPWGWQLDGHHLILNYYVQDNQVVMTPAFWGSEPAVATSGKYAGTRIMDAEQESGLAMIRSLSASQQRAAIIQVNKTGNNIMTQAFSDNVVLDYAGIPVSSFTSEQKALLMNLIGLYIGNMAEQSAEERMQEISAYLDQTWFAWIGNTDDNAVFYYRIQSPVLLIEFDHETPVGLTHLYPRGVPYKEHIHSIVRTPNGNDYGKDLLRQHYETHPH